MAFKLNILFTLIIYSFFLNQICAVPAYPGKITFRQPDGSTFIGKQFGDEWFSWIESENGEIILRHANNYEFQYAQIKVIGDSRILEPSGIKYTAERSQEKANDPSFSSQRIPIIEKSSLYEMWTEAKNKATSINK